ncbi:MAG: hypothetical protein ACLFNZ_00670 [Spirochaetaceae bacterium]
MEENTEFFDTLEKKIEEYRNHIESKDLPSLKENFRNFHNSLQAILNILIRKGLLQEDPYKNELRISDIQIPPTGPMRESEKVEELSRRLSQYDAILEFLNNYYQFQLDSITLPQIKKLVELTTYIKWESLTETSSSLNTRILAEIIKKIPQGTDKLSFNIINDSIQQLNKTSREILKILKKISTYQREKFKYDFRAHVLNEMNLKEKAITEKREEVRKAVKRKFAQALPNKTYFPELVEEVLDETEGPKAEENRREVLEKLSVGEEKPKQKEKRISGKSMIFDSFRLLSSGSTPLEQAITKLQYNKNLMTNKNLSFGEKFRRWLYSMTNKELEKNIFEIEYLDPATASYKPMQLDFSAFIAELQHKAKLLSTMSSRMSSTYQKLEAASEEKAYAYLSQTIEELQSVLLKLPALDTYFKHEVPKNQRSFVKGVRLETSALKNSVVKANQKRHEYVAYKEEIEQLKKLGVDTSVE